MSENSEIVYLAQGIDTSPVMPFFPLWDAWSQHSSCCEQCAYVIHETVEQAIPDLCWEGQGLNYALRARLRETEEASRWN